MGWFEDLKSEVTVFLANATKDELRASFENAGYTLVGNSMKLKFVWLIESKTQYGTFSDGWKPMLSEGLFRSRQAARNIAKQLAKNNMFNICNTPIKIVYYRARKYIDSGEKS